MIKTGQRIAHVRREQKPNQFFAIDGGFPPAVLKEPLGIGQFHKFLDLGPHDPKFGKISIAMGSDDLTMSAIIKAAQHAIGGMI